MEPGLTFDEAARGALATLAADQTVSMLVVSIDHFDAISTSHGRDAANEVLHRADQRMRDALRSNDTLQQCGDDEFVLLWRTTTGSPDIHELAARLAAKFHEPIITTSGQISVTISIGIASTTGRVAPQITPLPLQRQAQSAVQSAKREGRSQIAFFDQAVQDQALASYETERRLRLALSENDLDIAYQPIVSLHSGQPVWVEALARWNDDILGQVDPNMFIPIAEESGLIHRLGQTVMEQAVAQAGLWNQGDTPDTGITINLSNRQLLDPTLLPTVESLLEEHQLDPRSVCFEITESVVMSHVAASMTILGHMKDLGLRLAIDDFGTGYSSLSYLRHLPVDTLKIDKSFVQSIYNRDDRVITKAIIDLAHTLGMTTVAEGVETRLQVEVLHALNCDMAQGFYLHNPTKAAEVDFSTIDFETERQPGTPRSRSSSSLL